jgi:N-6 DNA Methylase
MAALPDTGTFIQLFNRIAGHRSRHDVFRDFVTMAAISLHTAVRKSEVLEKEYLSIIGRYDREAQQAFPVLLGEVVTLLEVEPRDILGQLYMSLDFGNTHTGQFFTPPEISRFMAKLTAGDAFAAREFVTLSEPACGSGGMVLAFAQEVIALGRNPATSMWVQCQDVDRSVAMMCYVQLALWNIPGVVIVGNTLAYEVREAFYTPAHYLWFWDAKLRRRDQERQGIALAQSPAIDSSSFASDANSPTEVDKPLAMPSSQHRPNVVPRQFGFDFEV